MLSVAQSIAVLVLGIIAIIILLWILVIVHKQAGRVRELEMRMKAMNEITAEETTEGEMQ